MVTVKGHSRKLKSGKTITVKRHSRSKPSGKRVPGLITKVPANVNWEAVHTRAGYPPKHSRYSERFDSDKETTADIVRSIAKKHKLKVNSIKKGSIKDAEWIDYYNVKTKDGTEIFLFEDDDDMNSFATDSLERTWYEYRSAGAVGEDETAEEAVERMGAAEIISGVDGAIHYTNDDKPYVFFNMGSKHWGR